MQRFEKSSVIASPVESVWALHERQDAIELLSPPAMRPRVLYKKGGLRTGSRVELRVPLGPFKMRWLALHVDHEDFRYFIDEQIRGPFRYWKHVHRFEPVDGGTKLTDFIEFSLPLGPVTDWIFGWAVKLQLRWMFNHRHAMTAKHCQ
jgi:ligand-binding SRPBCC domain-containing protein